MMIHDLEPPMHGPSWGWNHQAGQAGSLAMHFVVHFFRFQSATAQNRVPVLDHREMVFSSRQSFENEWLFQLVMFWSP